MTSPEVPEKTANVSDRASAVALMCGAVTLFACLDATAKYLGSVSELPTAEIVWMRFAVQMALMVAIFGPRAVPRLRSKRLGLQLLRSTLLVATTITNFIAVQFLRLDQTVSVAFLAPLAVAVLAGPVLGERVGRVRIMASLAGFAGILIVIRPGLSAVHPAIAFSIVSMLAYTAFILVTRKLAGEDPTIVTLFFSLLVGCVMGVPFAVWHWVWPAGLFEWLLVMSLGVFGGIGHYLLILAYRAAPASTVSPFIYFQLFAMIAIGYVVFGDAPDGWTLAGASIVIASGVYLVRHERRLRDFPS